jgi:hypothetical protein
MKKVRDAKAMKAKLKHNIILGHELQAMEINYRRQREQICKLQIEP